MTSGEASCGIVATTPGSLLAGRYLVEKMLGEGGMALVVEAKDLRTDRRVALKILKPEVAAHREAVERFRREGEFLTRLRHPALVAVEAVGTLEDSRLYLAMELLVGETLGALIRKGKLSPAEISPILAGAAVGLDAAHRAGAIHRDLKPENVFLQRANPGAPLQVKLLDFGISKIDGRASLTRTGQVLGTPRYMAPEQLRGEDDLDPRVDVYALGVILYEALTGTAAFPAQLPNELILSILNGKFVPIRAMRRDISAELEAVVLRAMSKAKEARFSSAVELAEAWFEVVHRDDGPKVVRAGVATNVLGSVVASAFPPSPFSAAELRPATFREFQAARQHQTPREARPLVELVREAGLGTERVGAPDVTTPPLAMKAASVSAVESDAPASRACVVSESQAIRAEPMSEALTPPTKTLGRWPFVAAGVALLVLVLGAAGFALFLHQGKGAHATAEGGSRFVHVPLFLVDAGGARDGALGESMDEALVGSLDGSVAEAIRDAAPNQALPETETARISGERATIDPDPSSTRGASSTRSVNDERNPRAPADAGRTGTEASSAPWTGDTDVAPSAPDLAPSSGPTSLERARSAAASGDARRCVELASEAIAGGAEASAYRVRGDCYRALGDAPHALRSYQRFCTLAPNSSQIAAVRRAAETLGGTCP